jgi:hypothetical protein
MLKFIVVLKLKIQLTVMREKMLDLNRTNPNSTPLYQMIINIIFHLFMQIQYLIIHYIFQF